jgi:hypothetical protein
MAFPLRPVVVEAHTGLTLVKEDKSQTAVPPKGERVISVMVVRAADFPGLDKGTMAPRTLAVRCEA